MPYNKSMDRRPNYRLRTLSRGYVRSLVRAGSAREIGLTDDNGFKAVIVEDLVRGRVVHYWATPADEARLGD